MTVEVPARPVSYQPPCPCCTEVPECVDIGSSIACLVRDCTHTAVDGDFCTGCRLYVLKRRARKGLLD